MLIKIVTLPKKIPTYIKAESIIAINAHPENLMETNVMTSAVFQTERGPQQANYLCLDNADSLARTVNKALKGQDTLLDG